MIKNDQTLRRIVACYIEGSECPDMRVYGQGFLDHFEHCLGFARRMMALGNMHNGRVLDLGCGFGWYSLLISLLGDNEVVANDIRPLMIRNIEERIRAVEEKFGYQIPVRTLCGDFMETDIPSESFDAVFCHQTIEHVHDLDACFQRAKELLSPGGFLVITNDNNRLKRKHLREIEEMWTKRDTSWDFIRELQEERPVENKDISPYASMREEIIRREGTSLDDRAVQSLVHATAGLTELEIGASVQRFFEDSTLPTRPKFSWCRNPITGEYCERQFDPFEVKRQLQQHGFRVRLLQNLQRGGLFSIPARIDLGPLNRVLFMFRAAFVLVARKSGNRLKAEPLAQTERVRDLSAEVA